jgi:Glutaredoxin-like domain (DUF836)
MTGVVPNVTVLMYSRSTCHLCDEARAEILAAIGSLDGLSAARVAFDERIIDGDDDLEREYGLRVPVVEVDGVEEFEYRVDQAALREMLAGT